MSTNAPSIQEPVLITSWEADVRRLMADIKVSRGPSGKLIKLLQKVGCVTNSSVAWMEFKDPREDRRALVIEALAFASGVYATHHIKGTDSLARVMHAVASVDAWSACIAQPHGAHAFARNGLLLLDHSGSKTQVLRMFSAWLRPPNRPYRSRQDSPIIQRDVLTDMFGEHWWMFNAPEAGKAFDPNIILHLRPAFLPGVLPAVAPELLLALPEMDLG